MKHKSKEGETKRKKNTSGKTPNLESD